MYGSLAFSYGRNDNHIFLIDGFSKVPWFCFIISRSLFHQFLPQVWPESVLKMCCELVFVKCISNTFRFRYQIGRCSASKEFIKQCHSPLGNNIAFSVQILPASNRRIQKSTILLVMDSSEYCWSLRIRSTEGVICRRLMSQSSKKSSRMIF